MRILFLLHSYVSAGSVHGVGKFSHYLAKNLEHEVVVIDRHFAESYSSQRHDYDGVIRYTIYSPDSKNMLLRDHQYEEDAIIGILRNVLAKEQPFDLVHVQHLISWPNKVLDYFRDIGLPVVLSVHDTWYICPALNYYNRFHDRICSTYLRERTHNNCSLCLQGLNEHRYDISNPISWYEEHILAVRKNLLDLLNKTDTIVFPSQKMIDLYKKEGLLHKKIVKIPHFLDYQPVPQKTRGTITTFGYTGNISLGKGIEQLLSAFFYTNDADVRLRIYGNPLDAKLAETVRQYCERDSRITYEGPYNDEGVFSELDVVIVPSVWPESFNLCAYEAVQREKHVLVSETAYQAEFLNESNCTVFDPKSLGDLQKKLRLLHGTNDLPTKRVEAEVLGAVYSKLYAELLMMSGSLPIRVVYLLEKKEHVDYLQSAFLNADEIVVLFNPEETDLQSVWKSIKTEPRQRLAVQPMKNDAWKKKRDKDTAVVRLSREIQARDIAIAYKNGFATSQHPERHIDCQMSFSDDLTEETVVSFYRRTNV